MLTAKQAYKLSLEGSKYSYEVYDILKQIKSSAKEGCTYCEIKNEQFRYLSQSTLDALKELGYKLEIIKDDWVHYQPPVENLKISWDFSKE